MTLISPRLTGSPKPDRPGGCRGRGVLAPCRLCTFASGEIREAPGSPEPTWWPLNNWSFVFSLKRSPVCNPTQQVRRPNDLTAPAPLLSMRPRTPPSLCAQGQGGSCHSHHRAGGKRLSSQEGSFLRALHSTYVHKAVKQLKPRNAISFKETKAIRTKRTSARQPGAEPRRSARGRHGGTQWEGAG